MRANHLFIFRFKNSKHTNGLIKLSGSLRAPSRTTKGVTHCSVAHCSSTVAAAGDVQAERKTKNRNNKRKRGKRVEKSKGNKWFFKSYLLGRAAACAGAGAGTGTGTGTGAATDAGVWINVKVTIYSIARPRYFYSVFMRQSKSNGYSYFGHCYYWRDLIPNHNGITDW